MPLAATRILIPDGFLAVIGAAEILIGVLALATVAILAWQLWSRQRDYALELAEQAQQTALEQEKARKAQEENEALLRDNRGKSEMIATLSREIRGSLNGIMGSADLLLHDVLKPRQREHLATLRASAQSLHQSLNDVLDYSSIETGQIQIATTVFDLRQPLIEVVETLAPLALLKDLELVLIVAPDVPAQVTGDAARLRQVLINLMSNAVRFTAQGRVVLRVTISATMPVEAKAGTTSLHFSVTDTGPGIPEAMQATIFDRGTDANGSSPRNFAGAGLELAISKRLVELMGGEIGARSLPEGGSEFWVMLALPAEKEPPLPGAAKTADLHVVVLDDLAASRMAISAMLIRLGVDQDATDSVAKAGVFLRDAAESGARELVLLLDDSVARQNHDELARLFTTDETLRAARVVLMSRDADTDAVNGRGFPLSGIVRKPVVRLDTLLDAVRGLAGLVPTIGSRVPFDPSGEAKSAIHRGPHVLVVDDDNISRSVTFQLLEILGCAVEVAVSGPEAVERARARPFELILMDCQMPGMDGYEATRRILADGKGKSPPIVALTANTSDRDREKCFAAGMNDFIAKPVRKADLGRVLKQWIPEMAARS